MKQLTFLSAIGLIFACSFATCEKKCFNTRCTQNIGFVLTDKVTQQDLVFGANKKYSRDSMQLNFKPDFRLGVHENFANDVYLIPTNNQLLFTNTGREAVDTTYLRLAYNDIDTIIVQHSREQNDCCTSGFGRIVSIKFNGLPARQTGDVYSFEK
jgi:hypothetical protein